MELRGNEMVDFMNGLGAKVWRAGFGLLAVAALAACDPVPTGDTSCKSAYSCDIIKLTAQVIRSDIGKNYGGGVVLRNARAIGQTLVIDVTLPLSSAAFKEPIGQQVAKDLGKNIGKGFCSGRNAEKFFEAGNTLRARGFSKDNKLVADQIVRSCGRG